MIGFWVSGICFLLAAFLIDPRGQKVSGGLLALAGASMLLLGLWT